MFSCKAQKPPKAAPFCALFFSCSKPPVYHRRLLNSRPCRGRDDLKCAPRCSAHIQRKDYFYFAILENLRIFQNCLFTGGGVAGNGSCSAAFCESAALWRGYLFAPIILPLCQRLPFLGELANPKDLTERARMLSLLPRGLLNSLWQSRTPSYCNRY